MSKPYRQPDQRPPILETFEYFSPSLGLAGRSSKVCLSWSDGLKVEWRSPELSTTEHPISILLATWILAASPNFGLEKHGQKGLSATLCEEGV